MKKHHRYKHGKSRRQQVYREIAFKCLDNRCSVCGSEKKLYVHHIDKNYMNNKIENLAIMCATCHQNLHAKGIPHKIKKYYTQKDRDSARIMYYLRHINKKPGRVFSKHNVPDGYIRTKDVQNILGISRQAIHDRIKHGSIKYKIVQSCGKNFYLYYKKQFDNI